MTVAELIEKLREMPQDAQVFRGDMVNTILDVEEASVVWVAPLGERYVQFADDKRPGERQVAFLN